MTKDKSTLDQMDQLLDQLLDTAQKLWDLAKKPFDENELGKLQDKQEDLVNQLTDLDVIYKTEKHYENVHHHQVRTRIDHKIEEFQRLNDAFIETLRETQGLNKN